MNNHTQPMFQIWHGGNKMKETVELDVDSRRYIHVTLKNIIHTYNSDGDLIKTIVPSKVTQCSQELFKTDFEK